MFMCKPRLAAGPGPGLGPVLGPGPSPSEVVIHLNYYGSTVLIRCSLGYAPIPPLLSQSPPNTPPHPPPLPHYPLNYIIYEPIDPNSNQTEANPYTSCMHAYTHTYTHIHTDIHTHSHIHTCIHLGSIIRIGVCRVHSRLFVKSKCSLSALTSLTTETWQL